MAKKLRPRLAKGSSPGQYPGLMSKYQQINNNDDYIYADG